MQENKLFGKYTLQGLLDQFDVIECFGRPGKDMRIGEVTKKQQELYNILGVAPPPLTPPKGLLGVAIGYTLKNWQKLIVYTTDGLLRPDNNIAENAMRPFVLGRKNWGFAGHPNAPMQPPPFSP